jgi:hypothetical protein
MIYSFPDSIVLSFLGGTFGNALGTLIESSLTGKVKKPVNNTFHVNNWPFASIECTITKDSILNFTKKINPTDLIYLHCLNAELVQHKFPTSRCILLTCQSDEEYFGIQRQWLVNTNPIGVTVENILSAWDWINFNINYYNASDRILTHNDVLCLDFKSVVNSFDLIENYLKLKLLLPAKQIYISHYQSQMELFYNQNTSFNFAWNILKTQGCDAPIENLAKRFIQ